MASGRIAATLSTALSSFATLPNGTTKDLRCKFSRSPSVRVKCSNGSGHSITVTKTQLIPR